MSLLLGSLLTLASPAALAADSGTPIGTSKRVGIGIILGDPTGLSGKFYLGGRTHAIDFALAYNAWSPWYGHHDAAHVHVDYLWHPGTVLTDDSVVIPWHIGVGGFFEDYDFQYATPVATLGVRVPLGVDVDLRSIPLQFFGDVALDVGLLGHIWIFPDVGIGARYYF